MGAGRDVSTEVYRSSVAQALFYVDGQPLSLDHYPMYPAIYDGKYSRLLLKTGRQVAKSVVLASRVLMADGTWRAARDVRLGDVVATTATDGAATCVRPVTWTSHHYEKPCLRLTTRLGHVLEVATTHPIRTWKAWVEAGELQVGARVASIRKAGEFGGANVPAERIRLTGYLIGDGHLQTHEVGFTALPGPGLDEVKDDLTRLGMTYGISTKRGSRAVALRTHRSGPLRRWLYDDGLMDTWSDTKFIPVWVFALSRANTAMFINRLWSTDGCVNVQGSQYTVEYASNSKRLCKELQALLWKFGIPSSLRVFVPKVYRDRGEDRPTYKLRIETQDGVRQFIEEIGVIGKTSRCALPATDANNNRDTYPIEIVEDIQAAYGKQTRRGRWSGSNALAAKGLRRTAKHPPSRRKLREYVEAFDMLTDVDRAAVDRLRAHIDTDLYWDEIVSIEPIGTQTCVDFTVEDTHNFVVDGVVTHNSTTIACFMIAEAIGNSQFKSFYISPSQEQTRKFSHTRIAKILSYSPDLRKSFVGPESIDNVLLRMLRNGSELAFTYALDDPDRARGFSADRCSFDEVQDILYESVIPVIEECFSAGTQVLTRRGWIDVAAVALDDAIADVADDGRIEWHVPSQLVRKHHTGPMVTFNHDGIQLRVTGDHQMWAHPRGETRTLAKASWQFMSASDLATGVGTGEAFRLTGPSGSRTAAVPAVRSFAGIPGAHGVNARGFDLPYLPFARLVGWYIAEGCLRWVKKRGVRTCPRPCITQTEGPGLDDILRTIEACGLTYTVYANSKKPQIKHVTINSRLLGEYFKPLGDTFAKYIPEEFFAHESLMMALLEGLYRGDATKRAGMPWDRWTLFTVSLRLADDVHRAWTLCGRSPRLRTKSYAPDKTGYEVCAYVDNFFIFYNRKQPCTVETVHGEEVFCFTVPHHRPVVRGGWGQRPVVTGQCMSNSKHAYSVYAGTPKTSENTIEFLWSLSSKTEWCMKCSGCGKYTFIESVKAIGKMGPECLNCRKALDPRTGIWVDMATGGIKGFHIAQPIMPENVPASWPVGSEGHKMAIERWNKLLFKMESPLYGESRFLNECIGVSTSTGVRLLTLELLRELCDENHEMTREPIPHVSLQGITRTFAGVDWSGGGGEVKGSEGGLFKSRTVLHIWGQDASGRLKTLFYKIFPNGHAVGWIDEIVTLCNLWGVVMLCADAGEGALANSLLRQRLGDHRVVAIRYMGLSKPVEWNANALAYHVDRTTMIDNYARFLMHKQAMFPRYAQAKPAFDDILNVYEEVTLAGRKVWRHSPTAPDDCLHAQLFGWFAWRLMVQDLSFM